MATSTRNTKTTAAASPPLPLAGWATATIKAMGSEAPSGSALDGNSVSIELERAFDKSGSEDRLTICVPGARCESQNGEVDIIISEWDDAAFASTIDALIAMRVASRMRGQR